MKKRDTLLRIVAPLRPDAAVLELAGELLRQGLLVAFPTETVYGLGANALDPVAVASAFEAKDRPAQNPLIVHVSSTDSARELTTEWPTTAQKLAELFWPGPLTLVLPRSRLVPDVVTAGGATVAIRIPSHPVALSLVRAAGVPVAAPSANRSGEISPTTAAHVLRALAGRIDMILDGGATTIGLESTVLDLTSEVPRILRPGHIGKRELEAVVGRVHETTTTPAGPLRSPGMMPKHYAPRTVTELASMSEVENRVQDCLDAELKVGLVACGQAPTLPTGVIVKQLSRNAAEYGASLYASLHELDALGLDRILIVEPPRGENWIAIHDRLRRAAEV